jgi:uncharacterized membrane protein YedE/YeeE
MNENSVAVLCGLGLAVTSTAYYVSRRASLAGSGHLSRVVDAVWKRKSSDDELVAALLAATTARFGAAAVDQARSSPRPHRSNRVALNERIVFLLAIALGGLLAHPPTSISWRLDPAFDRWVAGPFAQGAVLLAAGTLVGFGARLAGGCTTGHGLVGVAQLQKGSWVSTTIIFATAVATTLLLLT